MGRFSVVSMFSLFIVFILLFTNGETTGGNGDDVYNTSEIVSLNITDGFKPEISPCGTKILYFSNMYQPDLATLWIADIDGSNRTMIYANASIDNTFTRATFSPDGNKILFVSLHYDNKTGKLAATSIDILIKNGTMWDNTSKHEQIYLAPYSNGRMRETCYNPSGDRIVYRRHGGTSTHGDIWIMDADGTNHTSLTEGDEWDSLPCFSPDGEKIVYLSIPESEETYKIWMMNTDGSNKKCLTPDDWYYDTPVFTPNGKIIFESARVSPHSSRLEDGNIWMMDMNGKNHVLIVPTSFWGDVHSRGAVMSPDNTMIVFSHGLGEGYGLYCVEDPTGEWKDSDGDGVWDGIDGAPFDPDEGYFKDDSADSFDFGKLGGVVNVCIVALLVFVVVVTVVVVLLLKSEKRR